MTTGGIQNSNTHPDESPTWSSVHKKGPTARNIYVSCVLEVWDVAAIGCIMN